MKNIEKIAQKLKIKKYITTYGKHIAKIDYNKINKSKKGKLILVTATNGTMIGSGKTTVSIGVADALKLLNKKTILTLREPSLGPVFGVKGGATGGGKSIVVPSDTINLNFTGDFAAISAANNLLCAAVDNHIFQGNKLKINKVTIKRCIDINDRTLRNIDNAPFDITAASELMAIFTLSKDLKDLIYKCGNIIIGYTKNNEAIFAKQLKIENAMASLLIEALKPNLVQTKEETPTIIHGGPFANIAHGCNSVIALNTALNLADYVVTEAGFGSDLGGIKFFDIVSRQNKMYPDAVLLVTNIPSLKYHSGKAYKYNSLEKGIENLEAHIQILKKFTDNIIVTLNKFPNDKEKDIQFIEKYCQKNNVLFSISSSYDNGSLGSIDLAKKIISVSKYSKKKPPIYTLKDDIKIKIEKILKEVLNCKNINYTKEALEAIKIIEKNSLNKYPICIAKTQFSISDDKNKLGNPKDYNVLIKNIKLYNGAGYICIYLADIMTMPGLPKIPNYEKIKIDGEIVKGIE